MKKLRQPKICFLFSQDSILVLKQILILQTLNKAPLILSDDLWDSLPKKPLPGRLNLVLSRDLKFEAEGAIVCGNMFEALELAREHALDDGADDICIIGGANIYSQTLSRADRLYITRVHASPEGDVFFPEINKDQWVEVENTFHPKAEGDDHDFTTLVYDRRAWG